MNMDDFSFQQASEEVIDLATTFVEKYVDYVENLPFDLQRSVTRLREIDCDCREVLTEIETLYSSFTKEKDINLKRRTTLVQIQRLFGRCQELGDEKISIVQQLSESIENRKKQLEHASYRFKTVCRPDQKNEYNGKREGHKSDCSRGAKRPRRNRHQYMDKHNDKDIKITYMDTITPTESQFGSNGNSNDNVQSQSGKHNLHLSLDNTNSPSDAFTKLKEDYTSNKKSDKAEKKDLSPVSNSLSVSTVATSAITSLPTSRSSVSSKTTTISKTPTSNKTSLVNANSNGANKNSAKGKKKKKKSTKHHIDRGSTRSPSPQVDIPIDPDEPTYCLCDQVSFGQMIGCDNKKCPIEWFHFSCVGLTHKPKGKWYCPDCLRDMKDKKKDSKRDHR